MEGGFVRDWISLGFRSIAGVATQPCRDTSAALEAGPLARGRDSAAPLRGRTHGAVRARVAAAGRPSACGW